MCSNMFKTGLRFLWISVLVLLLDRVSKSWVVSHVTFSHPLTVLPIFNLTLAYNTGAAFSFLHAASGWQNVFLGSLALIISVVVLYWLITTPASKRWMNCALCLVLGGALGNAWDRFLYGYVIDFFDFHLGTWHFAIFNVADSAICVGAAMLFFQLFREGKR